MKAGRARGSRGPCERPAGLSRAPLARGGRCAARRMRLAPRRRETEPGPLACAGVQAAQRSFAEGGGDKGHMWLSPASLPRPAAHPRKTLTPEQHKGSQLCLSRCFCTDGSLEEMDAPQAAGPPSVPPPGPRSRYPLRPTAPRGRGETRRRPLPASESPVGASRNRRGSRRRGHGALRARPAAFPSTFVTPGAGVGAGKGLREQKSPAGSMPFCENSILFLWKRIFPPMVKHQSSKTMEGHGAAAPQRHREPAPFREGSFWGSDWSRAHMCGRARFPVQ